MRTAFMMKYRRWNNIPMRRYLTILVPALIVCTWLYLYQFASQQQQPTNVQLNRATVHRGRDDGKILITGGLGYLGLPLVRHLLELEQAVIGFDIQPLDVLDDQEIGKLNETESFWFFQGDVRNLSLLMDLFSKESIRGVIHLASLSKEWKCEFLKESCLGINVGGTHAILTVISAIPIKDRPWFILGSGREVYGGWEAWAMPINEQSEKNVGSHLGLTRLGAERLVMEAAACSKEPFKPLPLPTIDQQQREPVVAKYQSAAAALASGEASKADKEGETQEGKAEGDLVVDSIVLRFSELYGNVHGDKLEGRRRLVTRVTHAAIQHAPIHVANPAIFLDILHVSDAVRAVVQAINRLDSRAMMVKEEKGSSLRAMMDCRAIDFNIGSGFVAKGERLVRVIRELTHSTSAIAVLPPVANSSDYYSCDLTKSRDILGYEPQMKMGLRDYVADIKQRTLNYLHSLSSLHCIAGTILMKGDSSKPKGTAKTIPATRFEDYLYNGGLSRSYLSHYLTPLKNRSAHLAHNNPCKAFPYVDVTGDPVAPEVAEPTCKSSHGGGESLAIKRSYCEKVWEAIEFVEGEWQMKRNFVLQECAKSKADKDMLPACDYDCNHPTICFQTGRCRCVDYGRCQGNKYPYPALSTAVQELNVKPGDPKLMPFVLTPLGRILPQLYPKVHVIPVPFAPNNRCNELHYDSTSCFSATARFLEGFRSIAVPKREANLFVVPFYQVCDAHLWDYNDAAMKYIKDIQKEDPSFNYRDVPIIWIMVHDWSKCVVFHWSIADMRRSKADQPHPFLARDNVHVFQTNGDANTNCYDQSSDIVIPPQTCNTPKLLKFSFEDWTPIRWRPNRMFLAATGYSRVRKQLLCKGLYVNTTGLDIVTGWAKNYIHRLNGTRFCLCPRGVAGWAPRLIDSISMGCIPVLISDYTVYPYQNLIDYSKFSIFLREAEAPIIEQLLDSIPIRRLQEMQLALAVVRDSFLYGHYSSRTAPKKPIPHSPFDLGVRALWLQRRVKPFSATNWYR